MNQSRQLAKTKYFDVTLLYGVPEEGCQVSRERAQLQRLETACGKYGMRGIGRALRPDDESYQVASQLQFL